MDRYQPYGVFALRIALGGMFVAHALLKLFVFTVPGTVGYFASQGFPGALAYPVIAGELIGGAALLAGVATRPACIALLPILAGAVFVHSGNGWVFSAPSGGWEYPLYLLIATGAQALLGPGAFAWSNRSNRAAGAASLARA